MPVYHYQDSPLVDSVEIGTTAAGATQATMLVADNVSAGRLDKLREDLGADNYSTLMDNIDGKTAIQVRGIKSEATLLASLKKLGIHDGNLTIEMHTKDNQKQQFSGKIRQNSLFLSALFYDLGNLAYIVSGIQRGRHNKSGKFTSNDKSEIMIGAAFSVGDVLMTVYGFNKGDEELNAAAQGLKQYLKEHDVQLPEANVLNPDTLHQSGALKAIDRWFHAHIVQIKSMTEMTGGLFTMHSSVKPGNFNRSKLVAGTLLATAWPLTMWLDTPPGHDVFKGKKPEHPTIVEKIQDNPRGWIARPASMTNNLLNLWGCLNTRPGIGLGERMRFRNEVSAAQRQHQLHNTAQTQAHLAYTKAKQHDYVWNVISAGAFLVAHSLFGLSGSENPHDLQDNKKMMDDLILMSANTLVDQPPNVQAKAIKQTAQYVSKLSHITLNEEELANAIRDKMDSLNHSNWAGRVGAEQSSATTHAQSVS